MHEVTLIPGDGSGPEACAAARRCLDATGVEIAWDEQPAGLDVMRVEGTPLPDRTLASLRRNKVALKGPVATPSAANLRSVNVYLRQALDLFACVRPCRSYPGVPSPLVDCDVDIVIVRENTEDLYVGIEYEVNRPETQELIRQLNTHAYAQARDGRQVRLDSGLSIKPISVEGSHRITKFAFDYARKTGRSKITCGHKANIMKCTDGLFLQIAREVARDYPDIEFEDRVIDNLCMQLVQRPTQFDLLLFPNLYGDIVSDLAAGLVGGLGIAAGGNIGTWGAVFEATHGSAPKLAGRNRVNPTSLILAGTLMLRHLGEQAAAERLERAVAFVLHAGEDVTYDLKADRDDPRAVGTQEMADAIIRALPAPGR